MSTLFINVGLPASGKSTYSAFDIEDRRVIVSSDSIRKEFYGSEEIQGNPKAVFDEMFRSTVAYLKASFDVIYDSTNVVKKRRASLIRRIREQVKDVKVVARVFATPYEQVLKNNKNRDRVVPIEVIEKMYKQFQIPTEQEGFDKIKIIRLFETDVRPEDILEKNRGVPHDNPHHILDLYTHSLEVQREAYKLACQDDYLIKNEIGLLLTAARYHDMSKYKVKSFKKANGEDDTVAHYYGHANVSSYDFLSVARGNILDIQVISWLIGSHMFFDNEERFLEKIEKQYGEAKRRMLEILHKADKIAA